MLAKGQRSIEEAGFTSPAELDENMRRHKEAQRRLRKKRVDKKKQQRLMAEKAEQERRSRTLRGTRSAANGCGGRGRGR